MSVDTHWQKVAEYLGSAEAPALLARQWNADAHSLRLVNAGFNFVFRFTTDGQGRYLRVAHPQFHSREKVAAAIEFLQHLALQHAPVCAPVLSARGNLIEQVAVPSPHAPYAVATAVAEVAGQPLELDHANPAVYRAWGRSLAAMHNAAESYQPAPHHFYHEGDQLYFAGIATYIKPDDHLAQQELRQVSDWWATISNVPRTKEMWGLTHGDYRPGNVLWDGTRARTVDFDEPVYFWWAADVARALLEFWDKPQAFRHDVLNWFVQGYQEHRALDAFWIDNLTWLMRLKIMSVALWEPGEGTLPEPDAAGSPHSGRFLDTVRQRWANPQAW